MTAYQEKRLARIDRLQARAVAKQEMANATFARVNKLADSIPFGQPLMPDHHSYKRARRDQDRIHNGMAKGCELQREAEEAQSRAEAAAKNRAISSDDPDAPVALRAKFEKLEHVLSEMRRINKEFKRGGLEAVSGISDTTREKLRVSMENRERWQDGTPFERYQITNLAGRVRATRLRLESLEAKAGDETTEKMVGEVRVRDDVDENRLQLFFPHKPAKAVIEVLKANGFRWSPTNGAWQRQRSTQANWAAENVIKTYQQGRDE
jgi:hypothetical protein